MEFQCVNNCKVEHLYQLLICTQEGCTSSPLRCKECFFITHTSVDQQGKKKIHTSKKFDESAYYKNFLYLIKIYEIMFSKFRKSFGRVNQNVQYYTFQIFSTSEIVTKAFSTQQAISQFYILKELYYHRPAQFLASPSSDIVSSLSLVTEKSFNTAKNQLIQPTQQEQYLSFFFNQISNNNPSALQIFIQNEQQIFTKYCLEIKQKQKQFQISDYIDFRNKDQSRDKVYFSRAFQSFLKYKYEQNPEEQQLFTPSQYTNYVWQNLETICKLGNNAKYLDLWVENYKQFVEFMHGQNLQTSLLAFRMWKDHVPETNTQNKENHQVHDKYFLDNFILAFIEVMIKNQYCVIPSQAKTWSQFLKYLPDFVQYTKHKGEQFVDISKYAGYYEFRVKSEELISQVQKSAEISYNKAHTLQYLNNTYKEGKQINKNNYKKFIAAKEEQQVEKQKTLKVESSTLNKELQSQEGEKFYQIIFDDYLRACLKNGKSFNKDGYAQFKKQVLQNYDQQQIKLSNDKILLAQKQALQSQFATQSEKKEDVKVEQPSETEKVKYNIDQAEQNLADLQNSEDEELPDPNCPCCDGKPEECQKPECLMLGYCVNCSL